MLLRKEALPADNLPFKTIPFRLNIESECESHIRTFEFLRPMDPDEVLDSIPDDKYEKDKFLPYWAEHWPSSDSMISFINKQLLPEKHTTLELGCGLGVLSTVCSCNHKRIFSTDISFDSCMYTHANLKRNHFTPGVFCSDWRALPIKGMFDRIFASDILYEERWIEPIGNVLNKYLKNDGIAWIADPMRRHWNDFKNYMTKNDFSIEVVNRSKSADQKHTIEILELKKSDIR